MIQEYPWRFSAERFGDLREKPEQSLVGGGLVVERRQHQQPSGSGIESDFRKFDRIAERSGTGADDRFAHRQPALGHRFNEFPALRGCQRVRLASRSQRRQPRASVFKKPTAVIKQEIGVDIEALVHRRGHCGVNPFGRGCGRHWLSFGCSFERDAVTSDSKLTDGG